MKKTFDCVKMKHDIQEKLYKESHAKNLSEYVAYIQSEAKTSPLYSKIKLAS